MWSSHQVALPFLTGYTDIHTHICVVLMHPSFIGCVPCNLTEVPKSIPILVLHVHFIIVKNLQSILYFMLISILYDVWVLKNSQPYLRRLQNELMFLSFSQRVGLRIFQLSLKWEQTSVQNLQKRKRCNLRNYK